ncbi:DUF6894 family protein [Sphingopyxis sp.]|jgi:hypothetical protein|uniref:DUF6894 family protein n=1 Tax=Sphingopyxis sp. TaxID=1908224 RepID=UPI002DFB9391|nr:hypothetical protein [Sphingopyxis sp.]
MPRYYFHTCDGTQDIDRCGCELPDLAAAKREAIRYGGALLRDEPDLMVREDELRITVTDEDGALSCAIIILAVDGNLQKR